MPDLALYRFIGDKTLLHLAGKDIELIRFGQKVELSDADMAIVGPRVPLLTQDEFASCNFTDAELAAYPTANDAAAAPATFLAKKNKALEIFLTRLTQAYGPKPVQPTPAPAPAVAAPDADTQDQHAPETHTPEEPK